MNEYGHTRKNKITVIHGLQVKIEDDATYILSIVRLDYFFKANSR